MLLYSVAISAVRLFYLSAASGYNRKAHEKEKIEGGKGKGFILVFGLRVLESFSLLGFVRFSFLGVLFALYMLCIFFVSCSSLIGMLLILIL